jgi:hypothetical protein
MVAPSLQQQTTRRRLGCLQHHLQPEKAAATTCRRHVRPGPELLAFDDGRPVSAATWRERRAELDSAIVSHEFGGMPPAHERITVHNMASSTCAFHSEAPKAIEYRRYEIRTVFGCGKEVSINLDLWIPPGANKAGAGPLPVLLDFDGCWRYFNDSTIEGCLARGNIAASIDRCDAASDNKDDYRNTGLYRVFPQAEFAVVSAWAWAVHRAVDALLMLSAGEVEDSRYHYFPTVQGIAVTGHSRGGKTAMLAGATDERIDITNPNNSGIGGASLNRLKMRGSEEVNSFWSEGVPQNAFWFGAQWRSFRGSDAELPYDNHYLHAMVAPRGLLLTDAYEDVGANPAGTFAAAQAALEVYKLLGAESSIGWAWRESGHNHAPEDYKALLDFVSQLASSVLCCCVAYYITSSYMARA